MRLLIIAAILVLFPVIAIAQVYFPLIPKKCAAKARVETVLASRYGEHVIGTEHINFNNVDYTWTEWENPETGSWSIIITDGERMCLFAGAPDATGRIPLDEAMEHHMSVVMGQAL